MVTCHSKIIDSLMPNAISNYKATFKITKIFSVVGVGLIITGQIIDGTLTAGNYIQLKLNEVILNYEILAVEFVDYMNTKQSGVGLIFDSADTDLQEKLKTVLGESIKVIDKTDL
jgi:hypothetical protein